MIHTIYNIFYTLFSYFNTHYNVLTYLILLGLIVLFCYLIYKVYCFKLDHKYRIKNFYLTYFFVFIYIFYYIIIMLIFRYQAWGHSFDLHQLYLVFSNIYHISKVLLLFVLILLILIFLTLIKVRLFLLKEIRKFHLFYQNDSTFRRSLKMQPIWEAEGCPGDINLMIKSQYHTLVDEIKFYYTFHGLLKKIWSKINGEYYELTNKDIKYLKGLRNFLLFGPKLILIFLIIYDCYYYNFILTKIFYYLPFYIIYMLWYQATDFIYNTCDVMNKLLYERFYLEEFVIYARTIFSKKRKNSLNMLFMDASISDALNKLDEKDNSEEKDVFEDFFNDYLQQDLRPLESFLEYRDYDNYYTICMNTYDQIDLYTIGRQYVRDPKYNAGDNFKYTNFNTGLSFSMRKEDLDEYKKLKDENELCEFDLYEEEELEKIQKQEKEKNEKNKK